jgi:hypothetical protein
LEGSRLGPLAERLAELGELDAAVGLARPSPWHAFEVFTAIAARLPLDEVRKALSEHRWEARLWKPDARLAARLAQLGQVDEALSILAGLPRARPATRLPPSSAATCRTVRTDRPRSWTT